MNNTITCSFSLDRDVYNTYKSIISKNGENVEENIKKYIMKVIQYQITNVKTIQAIK